MIAACSTAWTFGEPVAVVVSTTREIGVDAAELVEITYEELPVVVDPLESVSNEILLFPEAETNVVFAMPSGSDSDPFADCDTVVEAVVEKLEVKRQIFGDLEAIVAEDAILATNTSSIELERISEGLDNPARLIGLHFFNPVAQLPLVEVIRSTFNSEADVAKGASFALAIGKSPVVVKSNRKRRQTRIRPWRSRLNHSPRR